MTPQLANHASSASSGALAGAICMAACQIVGWTLGWSYADALLFGLSLSSMAFGLTYAGVFFVQLRRMRTTSPGARGPVRA